MNQNMMDWTGFLEGPDGTIMVQLFPGTNIHVGMAQDAVQRLLQLLVRYNWTKSDPRFYKSRWRRFWRGIEQIERTIIAMFVRSRSGGEFRGTVELNKLPLALQPLAALRSRSQATDAVLREFSSLRQIFIRACLGIDEIASRWRTTCQETMDRCEPALVNSAAKWLNSDGSADLVDLLCEQLIYAGVIKEEAQQKALELSIQVRWLVQDRERIICDQAFNEECEQEDEETDRAKIETAYSGKSTTRECLVQARSGQGVYRDDLLALWGNACAVTGCSLAAVLIASHAKPWIDSTDGERLDPNNGLPLVGTLDKLFGAGLIAFDPDTGIMLVASTVGTNDQALLGIPAPLRRKPNVKQKAFLRYHLDFVFQWQ